jgi:putative transcriptional regulator
MKIHKSKLAARRRELHLTQEELAKKAGISRAYLANLESGNYTPSLEVAKNLSIILNVSVEELFFIN